MEFPDGNAVRTSPVDDSAIPHAPASCGKVCDRTPAGCVKTTLFFAASGALGATASGLVASVHAVATTVAIAHAASKFGVVRFRSIGFLWKEVTWVAARGVYESEHKRKRRDFLPRASRVVLAVSTPLSELHLSRTDALWARAADTRAPTCRASRQRSRSGRLCRSPTDIPPTVSTFSRTPVRGSPSPSTSWRRSAR